ncbi:LPS assembly lipoprotein LptE [uncultured Marinobacter sp.]|uniref:LPS-assembly lipoprotein LptE n=1 Tax=uncultured Marinobacter sp. TaxID=187379 RepID=UPI0025D47893|nr:LPS assembly lipoprotein LptE [uncultured Marinobacter sp.]
MSRHSALRSATRLVPAAVVATLLAGCGFQLRGAPPVSSALEPLAVDCSSQVPETLCRSLREQLGLGNVRLAPVADADYILRLKNFERDRRASAITAQAAAAEYTLRHSVELEVISADRVPMVATTRLNTSESYRYDATNVLARQREEETLRQQMDDRLAQQVIFRLAPLTPQRIEAIRSEYQRKQEADAPATGQP